METFFGVYANTKFILTFPKHYLIPNLTVYTTAEGKRDFSAAKYAVEWFYLQKYFNCSYYFTTNKLCKALNSRLTLDSEVISEHINTCEHISLRQ